MRRLKKLVIATFIALVFIPMADLSAASKQKLVILHTNDFHGHPLKFFHYPAPNVGGLPAIATFVNQVRGEYKNVLVLDAGDINTGRPESKFFKTVPDIIGYNYIAYDAAVLGNHEFDNPIEILQKQMKLANFPFISANIKTLDGRLLVQPYIIKDFKDFKVGIFGLTLKETEIIGNPEYIKDLRFDDEIETARKMVAILENKVDIIIALTHLGLWADPSKGSRRLAAEVQGIDLIVDGHTHTNLDEPVYVNGTPIVQAWQWGLKVGKGIMSIENGRMKGFTWDSEPINLKKRIKKADGTRAYPLIGKEYKEDQFLLSILTPYANHIEALLSKVIGKASSTFFNKKVRDEETPLGDLVADAMLWYTKNLGVDFAIQNGGGIRADLPKGDITKKLIYEILPFDNSVVTLKLKGSELQALFDFIATIPRGKGAFPQVSKGLRFTINYGKKSCENIRIHGRPIDPNRFYTVATNSYMASGGDGYKIFRQTPNRYDTSAFQRDIIIDYIISQGKTISPVRRERITIVHGGI